MDFSKIKDAVSSQRHIKSIRDSLKKSSPENILIIAHRGGPRLGAHENTIDAFEKAIECGADMIETDIRRTRDGVLVCHHDNHINSIRIADMNFFEANRMASEKGYAIPLLKDLIAMSTKRIKLDIEIKDVGYELEIIDLIRGTFDYSDFVMKSFNDSTVYAIKEIDPRITVGLLVEKHPFNRRTVDAISRLSYEARMAITGADFLSPEASLVNVALTTRMRLLRKKIFVWTVNGEEEIGRIIDFGVDAIITDEPDVALRLSKQRRLRV